MNEKQNTTRIHTTRFGTLEINPNDCITFPKGILGFPEEREFVLVEKEEGAQAGYLCSLRTSWLAFPVMDAALLAPFYPVPGPQAIAANAGLGSHDVAMLLIMAREGNDAALGVNLLAPLVIDMTTRTGAQVLLDPMRYSARLSIQHNQESTQNPANPAHS